MYSVIVECLNIKHVESENMTVLGKLAKYVK